MRFKKIKLISNPNKPWAKKTTAKLAEYLDRAGFRVVNRNADLSICLGGDGTILYANHDNQLEGVVLGIGGKKSMICQLTQDNWNRNILHMLKEAKTENRQLLFASAGKKTYTAINDFVIHSKDYRVIEMEVYIDGKHHSFEGDGAIVSSATGSYAYAYSAGGKRMKPRSKRIQVVPIAPYLRAFKPHVLPSNSTISIKADRESAFIVDGIFIKNLKAREKVTIKSGGFIKFLSKV